MSDAPVTDQRGREQSSQSIRYPSLFTSSVSSTSATSQHLEMKHAASGDDTLEGADDSTPDATASSALQPTGEGQSSPPSYGSLEGTLLYRKGLSAKTPWKQSMKMYCVLRMTESDGGSLSCYRFIGLSKKDANAAYTSTELYEEVPARNDGNMQLCLDIAADLPWVIRDVENDPTSFVVEIPTDSLDLNEDGDGQGEANQDEDAQDDDDQIGKDEGDEDDESFDVDDDGLYVFWGDDEDGGDENEYEGGIIDTSGAMPTDSSKVKEDLMLAASKGKPLRYCFKCPEKKSEKALWLKAFAKLGRLSTESRRKRSIFGSGSTLAPTPQRRSRIRTIASADFRRLSSKLEGKEDQDRRAIGEGTVSAESDYDGQELTGVKEYRVRPGYAYPQRWMTHRELTEDMMEPSAHFHDLRLPPATANSRELGLLRVEVLQCLGLPRSKTKTTSTSIDPNAVVYLVCGSYAFATDIIPSCAHPMWLRGMRRACVVPIFHGYAQLYAGVFHDDGSKSNKDVFIGRASLGLGRLRPGCTYDVTLPLRLSAHVYSRRKRGAIRLRFHLECQDERQLVLSYLPKAKQASSNTTTLTCGDCKAFRNVAMTVHGSHLPGKFSTDQFMATIREFKLVQKVVKRLLQQFAKDLIVWKNPAVSGFVFCAWMHCCYANSVALVPVYVTSFVFLQLMGNYARSVADGPIHQRFLPPTWEEMFLAAVFAPDKDSLYIMPLDMKRSLSLGEDSDTPLLSTGTLSESSKDNYIVQTHEPRGNTVFRRLGFIEHDDNRAGSSMEFPFSSLAGYPRFGVEESLATSKAPKDLSTTDAGMADEEGNIDAFGEEDGLDTDAGGEMAESRHPKASEKYSDVPYQPRLDFKKPLPEQNIDKKLLKDDKTITQELQEIEEKVNKITMNLFNSQAYLIKDTSTPAWGKRRRSEKENECDSIKRDLDKLLNLGQFSQWNPVVSKITSQFEPIFRIMAVILCAYRALFNIFTWQDPYVSFWFSIGCVAASVTLFVLPWRPIMFCVGLMSIGPQNWLIRVFREFVGGGLPSRFMRAFRELLKPDDSDAKESQNGASKVETIVQPVFRCHAGANKPFDERKAISSAGMQHVVVPYSPLICQRFYDWPPDPQYARVVAGMQAPAPLLPSQGEVFVAREYIKPLPAKRRKSLTQSVSQPDAESVPRLLPSLDSASSPSLGQSTSQYMSQSIRSSPSDRNVKESNASASTKFFKRTMDNLNESIAKRGRDKDLLKNTIVSFRKNPTGSHDEEISAVSTECTNKKNEVKDESSRSKAGTGLLSASKRLTSKFNRTKPILSAQSDIESEVTLTAFPSSHKKVEDEEVTNEADSGDFGSRGGNVSEIIDTSIEPKSGLSDEANQPNDAGCDTHERDVDDIGDVVSESSQPCHRTNTVKKNEVPTSRTTDAIDEAENGDKGTNICTSCRSTDEPANETGEENIPDTHIPEQLITAQAEVCNHSEDASNVSYPGNTEKAQVQDENIADTKHADNNAVICDPTLSVKDAVSPAKVENHDVSTQTTQADPSECLQAENGAGADVSLLEEFVSLKLELAAARTANDHHREKLRQTEEERDSLRAKYDALLKDCQKPQKYNLLNVMGRKP